MMTKATETKTNRIVAELFARLQQHHEEYGQAERDDDLIWQIFDACKGNNGRSLLQGIVSLAKQHAQFGLDQRIWSEDKLEQEPFRFRGATSKWKKSDDNRLIWKTLMQMYEVIKGQTRPDPKRDLFK